MCVLMSTFRRYLDETMQISEKLQGFPGSSEGKDKELELCEKEKGETRLTCTDKTDKQKICAAVGLMTASGRKHKQHKPAGKYKDCLYAAQSGLIINCSNTFHTLHT